MSSIDIIRLARQAGINIGDGESGVYEATGDELERFAQLVVDAERDACAELCRDLNERDECLGAADCEVAIRARSEVFRPAYS